MSFRSTCDLGSQEIRKFQESIPQCPVSLLEIKLLQQQYKNTQKQISNFFSSPVLVNFSILFQVFRPGLQLISFFLLFQNVRNSASVIIPILISIAVLVASVTYIFFFVYFMPECRGINKKTPHQGASLPFPLPGFHQKCRFAINDLSTVPSSDCTIATDNAFSN